MDEFAPETSRIVSLGDGECLVVRHGGKWYAVGSLCPHQNAPLQNSTLENGCIVCRRHGYRFDLKSGECRTIGGYGIPTYAIHLEGEAVIVTVWEEKDTEQAEMGANAN